LSVPAVVHRRPNATAFAGVFSATLLCFLAVGAVLPVLPRYVTGPLGGGDLEVGVVTGAFAFTAIVGRPIGGRLADRHGRRLVVLVGLAITALAGALYALPSASPG
jgi:MFS family permease